MAEEVGIEYGRAMGAAMTHVPFRGNQPVTLTGLLFAAPRW